jgi:hypothetical protein
VQGAPGDAGAGGVLAQLAGGHTALAQHFAQPFSGFGLFLIVLRGAGGDCLVGAESDRLALPFQARGAVGGHGDAVGKAGGVVAEVVLGRQEQAALGVLGIAGDDEAGAGGGDEGEADADAVEGGAAGLVEVGDGNEGDAGLFRQLAQGMQQSAHAGVAVAVDVAEEGGQRVDADQPHLRVIGEEGSERVEIALEAEHAGARPAVRDVAQDVDAAAEGSGGVQARADGIGGGVFVGDEEGFAAGTGGAVRRPGPAAGDAGGEVESEEAFAKAGVAGDEGELAEGDAAGPEPAQLGGRHLGGALGEEPDGSVGVSRQEAPVE